MIQGLYFTSHSKQLEGKNEITWLQLTPPPNDSDVYYHDNFIVGNNLGKEIEALIIECQLNEEQKGVAFATHLRFNGFEFPIYLIGKAFIQDLRSKMPNSILNTELIQYENDLDDLPPVHKNTTESQLKNAIKDGAIIISKPDRSSNHTISNEWGAFKLAQSTNTLSVVNNNTLVKEKAKTLYFKYLCLKDNVDFSATQNDDPTKIDCKNKNVLLIDDQADKGWEDIFKTILNTNNFTSVPISFLDSGEKDENKIFTDAEKLISTNDYDVVLLDLRLKSSDKSNTAGFNDITNFSGYQLLKKIKEKNKGIQVIIFTASNKAWNMKALLEAGADGYYIKQSPDFYYGENYAKDNFDAFHEEMKIAIERASFLKWFWKHTKELIEYLEVEYSSIGNDFINSVKLSLNYAYDTIENYHSYNLENQKFLNYTFVSYCNLVEFITNGLIKKCSSTLRTDKFDYKLRTTASFTTAIDVVKNSTTQYTSKLRYYLEDKTTTPPIMPYFEKDILHDIDFSKYQGQFGLNALCTFSAVLLLRYSGFIDADIQEYETLKRKRNNMMHTNDLVFITMLDCKDIFKMVYAVLKGEKIEEQTSL